MPKFQALSLTNATITPLTLPAGGGGVTIKANVQNATAITIDGIAVTLPKTYSVTATRSFALVAKGQKGQTQSATLTVTVAQPIPVPTPVPTPTPTPTPTPPPVPSPPPIEGDYLGPSNVPDIWALEMTDYASLTARAGYSLDGYNHDQKWAHEPEFGVDALGIKYLRFAGDPASEKLLAWFMALGDAVGVERDKVSVRYLLWIEDDVAAAFNELGMKLPGLESQTGFGQPGEIVSWRMWHASPVNNTYALKDYLYDVEHNASTDPPRDMATTMRTNRWYCIEVRVELNTPGQSNGYGSVHVDGRKVFESTTMRFRNDPLTKLRSFFINVYHGGQGKYPTGPMHYRIAMLAVSTGYIGVPVELLGVAPAPTPAPTPTPIPAPVPSGTYPTWRQGKPKDVFFQIPGTNMSALAGVSNITIDGYQGLAAMPDGFRTMANGGHWGVENKVIGITLTANSPAWFVEHPGSAMLPAIEQAMGPPQMYYYPDGLPSGGQSYSLLHHIPQRNRIMKFGCTPPFGDGSGSRHQVDGYDLLTKKYDPEGTFPLGPLAGYSLLSMSCAKHPLTSDIYQATASQQFAKWTQATGKFTSFVTTPIHNDFYYCFRGSIIDAARNRWVQFSGAHNEGHMQCIDLSTYATSRLLVTGAPNFQADSIFGSEAPGLVHDLDNDRYIVFCNNGKVYSVGPTTAVAALIAVGPPSVNGWNNRCAHFPALGGIAACPAFASPIHFMPTR